MSVSGEIIQRPLASTKRWMAPVNRMKGKTRPKKNPNLAEIRERLLCNRIAKRFTDYVGVVVDPNLTTKQKIIHFQKAIDDATGKKIHFASWQEQLLQSCSDKSKKDYEKTLEEVKINSISAGLFLAFYDQGRGWIPPLENKVTVALGQ